MPVSAQGTVTRLLDAMNAGSKEAENELFDLIHAELRKAARGLMRRERPDHTLQPTELVNEAYLKLFPGKLRASNRAHFFAAAANAMRQVLVDHARKREAPKHGGHLERVPFDAVLDWIRDERQVEMLDLEEALQELEQRSVRQHQVVILRFFGGLTNREIADHLGCSESTIEKDWRIARAFLRVKLMTANDGKEASF